LHLLDGVGEAAAVEENLGEGRLGCPVELAEAVGERRARGGEYLRVLVHPALVLADPRLDLIQPVPGAVEGVRGVLDLGVDPGELGLDPLDLGALGRDRRRLRGGARGDDRGRDQGEHHEDDGSRGEQGNLAICGGRASGGDRRHRRAPRQGRRA